MNVKAKIIIAIVFVVAAFFGGYFTALRPSGNQQSADGVHSNIDQAGRDQHEATEANRDLSNKLGNAILSGKQLESQFSNLVSNGRDIEFTTSNISKCLDELDKETRTSREFIGYLESDLRQLSTNDGK